MALSPTDPGILLAIVAGAFGTVLLVQARLQSRLLRRRIATGAGTVAVDPATGLFSSAAAWQCIRAEANRALRLERPLEVHVGQASDTALLDAAGRDLVFDMPAGAMGIRLDGTRVCVLSCAGGDAPESRLAGLDWRSTRIEPGEQAAATALAWISTEVSDA